MNVVMYVTIHELAHVACPEIGHTELFKKIFTFLLQVSMQINIYKHVDYSMYNTEYCGLTITESII